MNHSWINDHIAAPNPQAYADALQRQLRLTKPPGSLGLLEEIACRFAAWQNTDSPSLGNIEIRVFAADHGICEQNVSAFPQAVTQQMIGNFLAGGAAISVLASQLEAGFAVVNLGTIEPLADAPNLVNAQLANGTADFSCQPAMTPELTHSALNIGREQLAQCECDLFIGGEMGIGNTTSAAAIYTALLDSDLIQATFAGPGTGLDTKGVAHKAEIIKSALQYHAGNLSTPFDVLSHLGGLEIAALTGAYISAAQRGIPSLVDGFICTAAALLAKKMNPRVEPWLMFAHRSAEPAHKTVLASFNARAVLDLDMRLGEGSGAAVAVPILQSALALHNGMATFDSAGVSEA